MNRILCALVLLMSLACSGANVVTKTIQQSGGDYTSISAWEAGRQTNCVVADSIEMAVIQGSWSSPDTASVVIAGWETDSDRYIVITNSTSKHDGKRYGSATNAYRLEVSSGSGAVVNYEDYAKFYGLQIKVTKSSGQTDFFYNGAGGLSVNVFNCIFYGDITGTGASDVFYGAAPGISYKFMNCLIYNSNTNAMRGFVGANMRVYNCTLLNMKNGFYFSGAATNCLVNSCGTAFVGTLGDFNCSDQASAPGSSSVSSYDVAFVSEAAGSEDFHITAANTSIIDVTSDQSGGLFSDDIDGVTRVGSWCIGADEYVAAENGLQAGQGVYVYGTNLNLTGSGFAAYSGTDAPFPSYLGQINAGTQYVDVTMSVALNTVGPHKFFLYFLDYDYPDFISLPAYSTNAIKISYRNTYSGRWSGGIAFTNAAPLTSIVMRFDRTNDLSTIAKLLISGLFITTNMISTVDRDGYLLDWTYPTTMDTNAANKGNIVHDSSFEGRGNEGWGISKQSRTNYFLATYNTNTAYHGQTALQLPIDVTATYVSRLYKVADNKQHTVSVYARATDGTATAEVGFQNAKTPPSGLGLSNRQWAAVSMTVTTNWTRLSTNFYSIKYPESEFRVTLRGTAGAAAGVLFDAVQVEEGTLDTYAPQSSFEIGLATSAKGNVFASAEIASVDINCFNTGATSQTQRVQWRITDNMHRILRAGATNYTLSASNRGTINIPHGLSQAGWFCFDAWVDGLNGSGDELQYTVNLTLGVIPDFGVHVESTFARNPEILAALGAQWTRGLSVFQAGRWAVAEPTTPGTFVWSDAGVALYNSAGLRLMQNLGENIPAWAIRQYFTLTNLSGSFTLGETISSGTNTAQVAWILVSTNYTGNALQLTNVVGSFASNNTVTGASSGATATVYCTPVLQTPDLYRWGLYVSNWVSHYGTNIPSIEIWNEPNQDTEIPKPNGSLAFYAEILRIALNHIKTIQPTVETVAMGGVLTTADITNTLNYLDATTLAKIDRVSVHLYDPNAAGAWAIYTNTLGYDLPIDNTESGFYDKGSYVGVNSPRKTEGYPVSLWNDLEWRVATAVEQIRTAARNVGQTKAGGLDRFFYYDFRYSGHMPETAGQGAQPSSMDYDDTIIAKGVATASILRQVQGYTGAGPVTTKNTNVWGLLWSRTNGSAAMIWATNNTGYQLVLTNGYATSKVLDVFGTALATAQSTVSVVRLPRFIFSESSLAVLSNAVATAAITAVTDTEPPTARITICPTGQVPESQEVTIKWMGTDQQSMPNEGSPTQLQFQWRLVGLENDWTTPIAQVFTVYDNLPVGQYTFQLRAVDAAGNVSPFDSRAFSVGTAYNGKPKAVGNAPTGSLLILNN